MERAIEASGIAGEILERADERTAHPLWQPIYYEIQKNIMGKMPMIFCLRRKRKSFWRRLERAMQYLLGDARIIF